MLQYTPTESMNVSELLALHNIEFINSNAIQHFRHYDRVIQTIDSQLISTVYYITIVLTWFSINQVL